jgi:hypothetical protein
MIVVEEDQVMLIENFDACLASYKELREMIEAKALTEDVQMAAFELNQNIDDILTFIFGDADIVYVSRFIILFIA